ncbi:MAG: hypothetical protein WCH05_03185 [Chlorobiaceae bacterium]
MDAREERSSNVAVLEQEKRYSLEVRIQKIQHVFQSSESIKESCHLLVDRVEDSLEHLKERRTVVSEQLCEALAKTESLRKKDYNRIMDDVYNLLQEKENAAKTHFINFIEDQKEFAQSLKHIILNIGDYHTDNGLEINSKLREELSQIADLQEKRKDAVMKILTEFQETHKKVMEYLESLLHKAESISIRDIKNARRIMSNQLK